MNLNFVIFTFVWKFAAGNSTIKNKSLHGPSPYEILLPPVLLLLGGTLALSTFWMYTKLHCNRKHHPLQREHRVTAGSNGSNQKIAWENTTTTDGIFSQKLTDLRGSPIKEDTEEIFYTSSELEILNRFCSFQNKASELFRIAIPASVSLIICPITLFLHRPLVSYFWQKYETTPNINEAIACFLAPAGMVYAVSFGFAFQQVLSKQLDITKKVIEEVGQIDQLMSLASKLQILPATTKLKIYKLIKKEIIYMMQQLICKSSKPCLIANSADIWNIVDLLRQMPAQNQHAVDTAISHRIIKYISYLNNASDKVSCTHTRMHPLQWIFLELLGYCSFLGVLLVQVQSYRMELAMCIITVTSISMLCYVVSDLDAPFHGFFRIDLSILEAVMQKLQALYTAEYNRSMDIDFDNKTTNIRIKSHDGYCA